MNTVFWIELMREREWWVMVNSTCVLHLAGLPPSATPAEARAYAEQKLIEGIRDAQVIGPFPVKS